MKSSIGLVALVLFLGTCALLPSTYGACTTPSDCGSNAICDNGVCKCGIGFYGDGKTCHDTDECDKTRFPKAYGQYCSPTQQCQNVPGSNTCSTDTCRNGFTYNPASFRCEDINECLQPGTCGANSDCLNNDGSYLCVCQAGFAKDASGACVAISSPTTCTSAANCAANEFCNFGSGACDGSGVCTPKHTTCSGPYAPVRGCDAVVYDNECSANLAGTSVNQTLSVCTGSDQCDYSSYCEQSACDSNGYCLPTPTGQCTASTPFWGCPMKEQGTTAGGNMPPQVYNSACHAHQARVATDGPALACTTDADCTGPNQFCYSGYQCGSNPQKYCMDKPTDCSTHSMSPVLACNGQYYSNQCEAWKAGVSVEQSYVNDICLAVPAIANPLTPPCNLAVSTCVSDNNSPHGYKCICNYGYHWTDGSDVKVCGDIDECVAGTHNCNINADCTNTPGNYSCACKSGFVGDGFNCAALDDECALGTHNCGAHAICTNTNSGFDCSCPAGFTGTGAGSDCVDIDECQTENIVCKDNAFCQNTPGSAACACKSGYEPYILGGGNAPGGSTTGTTTPTTTDPRKQDLICIDINECLTAKCGENEMCVNTPGSHSCQCRPGYAKNPNGVCTDIDECKANTNLCPNGQCHNLPGSYSCGCVAPYVLEGKTCVCPAPGFAVVFNEATQKSECTDVDECKSGKAECPTNSQCTNTIGSYKCTCDSGYRTITDRSTGVVKCQDIDECRAGTHTCDSTETCVNLQGSFQCRCRAGYDEVNGLGMQSGAITDAQLSASSTHAGSTDKSGWRLDALPTTAVSVDTTGSTSTITTVAGTGTTTGWCPAVAEKGQYVQVVFDKAVELAGVATQGQGGATTQNHVRSFTLQVRDEAGNWAPYTQYGRARTFYGNWHNDHTQKHALYGPERVTGVRILPETWVGSPCLRFELFTGHCKATCGNGILERGEGCDDGNDATCDGCQACEVEQGWTCSDVEGKKSECRRIGDNTPSFDIPPTPKYRYGREGYALGFYVQATSPLASRQVKLSIARVVDLDPPAPPAPSPMPVTTTPDAGNGVPPASTPSPTTTATASNPNTAAGNDPTTTAPGTNPETPPAADKCPPRLPSKLPVYQCSDPPCLPTPQPSGMSIRPISTGSTSRAYFRWNVAVPAAGKWKVCFKAEDDQGDDSYHCVFIKIAPACPNSCSGNGKCSLNRCICKKEWTGVDCSRKRIGYCYAYGDPRFRSFDGRYFVFNGVGVYTLHKSSDLVVTSRHEQAGTGSLNTGVLVSYSQDKWSFQVQNVANADEIVYLNGERIETPTRSQWLKFDDLGIKVWVYYNTISKQRSYLIYLPNGRMVRAYLWGAKFMNIMTRLDTEHLGSAMKGLCGTFDANPDNDLPSAKLRVLNSDADNHASTQENANACTEGSNFKFEDGATCESVSDPTFKPSYSPTFASPEAEAEAQAKCAPLKEQARAYQECLDDIALTGLPEAGEGAIAAEKAREHDDAQSSLCASQEPTALTNTFVEDGVTYAMHDNTAKDAAALPLSEEACASPMHTLPAGWSVAPVNEKTKAVLAKYTLGSSCVVLADGTGYDSEGTECAPSVLIKPSTGNCVATEHCAYKVLVVRSDSAAATTAAGAGTSAGGASSTTTTTDGGSSLNNGQQGDTMFGEQAAEESLKSDSKSSLGLLPELWQEIALIAGVVCVTVVVAFGVTMTIRRRRAARTAVSALPSKFSANPMAASIPPSLGRTPQNVSVSQVDLLQVEDMSDSDLEASSLISSDEEANAIQKAFSAK